MRAGATPNDGVPDMTVISEIDEYGINTNIKVRYLKDRIYVSQHCSISAVSDNCVLLNSIVIVFSEDLHWYNLGGSKPLPSAEYL